jgi:hypothetical protein
MDLVIYSKAQRQRLAGRCLSFRGRLFCLRGTAPGDRSRSSSDGEEVAPIECHPRSGFVIPFRHASVPVISVSGQRFRRLSVSFTLARDFPVKFVSFNATTRDRTRP